MKSRKIKSGPKVVAILEKLSRCPTSTAQKVKRSKLISLLLAGHSNLKISEGGHYSWAKAKRWRDRWFSYEPAFLAMESHEKKWHLDHDLEQLVRKCLWDAPRPGAPGKITAEQYCQILEVALDAPA